MVAIDSFGNLLGFQIVLVSVFPWVQKVGFGVGVGSVKEPCGAQL